MLVWPTLTRCAVPVRQIGGALYNWEHAWFVFVTGPVFSTARIGVFGAKDVVLGQGKCWIDVVDDDRVGAGAKVTFPLSVLHSYYNDIIQGRQISALWWYGLTFATFLVRHYRVLTVPTTVVVAPCGDVVAVNYGVALAEKLQHQLDQAARACE